MPAYQSSYRKDYTAPTTEDFRDAPRIELSLEGGEPLPRAKWGSEWKKKFAFTPLQIQEMLTRGYDLNIYLQIRMWGKHAQIMFYNGNASTNFAEIDYVVASKEDSYIYISKIDLDDDLRGRGIGKNFMRNMIEFDMAMGSRELRFVAGYENGAYSWASMGARMNTDKFYSGIRMESVETMQLRLQMIKDILPSRIFDGAMRLSYMNGVNDPMHIARDFRHVVLPRELAPPPMSIDMLKNSDGGFFTGALYRHLSKLEDQPKELLKRMGKEAAGIRYAFESAAMQGQDGLSLPRYMLTATRWPAIVSYDDRPHMDKIGAWLGGWKTIGPVQDQPERMLEVAFA